MLEKRIKIKKRRSEERFQNEYRNAFNNSARLLFGPLLTRTSLEATETLRELILLIFRLSCFLTQFLPLWSRPHRWAVLFYPQWDVFLKTLVCKPSTRIVLRCSLESKSNENKPIAEHLLEKEDRRMKGWRKKRNIWRLQQNRCTNKQTHWKFRPDGTHHQKGVAEKMRGPNAA